MEISNAASGKAKEILLSKIIKRERIGFNWGRPADKETRVLRTSLGRIVLCSSLAIDEDAIQAEVYINCNQE